MQAHATRRTRLATAMQPMMIRSRVATLIATHTTPLPSMPSSPLLHVSAAWVHHRSHGRQNVTRNAEKYERIITAELKVGEKCQLPGTRSAEV